MAEKTAHQREVDRKKATERIKMGGFLLFPTVQGFGPGRSLSCRFNDMNLAAQANGRG
jgi:hypothetical protein